MTKKQKIWLVGSVGFLLLCGAILGVESFIQGQNAKTAEFNAQILLAQKSIQDLQGKIESETAVKDMQIGQLQTDLNKKQAPQNTTADIVNEWQNRVAQVICKFADANGSVYETDEGSSTLINLEGNNGKGILTAFTNKHVISDTTGTFAPSSCTVGVYGYGARGVDYIAPGNPFYYEKGDAGSIDISNPVVSNDKGAFEKIASVRINICTDSQVSLGDQVVILGYPSIGTTNGITATEGIISGKESGYYVTSAKIDHGNSGGAAILVKNDCWAGIPTQVVAGSLESLGRILPSSLVLGK